MNALQFFLVYSITVSVGWTLLILLENKVFKKSRNYKKHVKKGINSNKYGYASFYKFTEYYDKEERRIQNTHDLYTFYSNHNKDKISFHDDSDSVEIVFDGYHMIMKDKNDYQLLINFLRSEIQKSEFGIKIREW